MDSTRSAQELVDDALVGVEGLARLKLLAAFTKACASRQAEVVAELRTGLVSWASIGAALGVTSKAAQQRYGPKKPRRTAEPDGRGSDSGQGGRTQESRPAAGRRAPREADASAPAPGGYGVRFFGLMVGSITPLAPAVPTEPGERPRRGVGRRVPGEDAGGQPVLSTTQ